MVRRLVVIGGVAAGMSAAAKASREARDLEVVVLEQGPHVSYAACGMPYWLAGDIPNSQRLIARTPEQMQAEGVRVHVNRQVIRIDSGARTVLVRDLESSEQSPISYDTLVIATGARPARLPPSGPKMGGVFALRSLQSGLDLMQFLTERRPHTAVVVGGGYVAVEMAETFRRLGLAVTMVIRSGEVLRATLDDDLRKYVHDELEHHGVEIVQGLPGALEGNEYLEAMVLPGKQIRCDLALIAIGVKPNVELAHQAGVALGPTGAIATDCAMETNLPGVYAAGDCAEALHLITGEPAYIPLGSTANKQGRVAGTNAAGGKATFGGIVGTAVVRAFDLVVASTGLTAEEARARGIAVEETVIRASDIANYFPGAADIHVKLVMEDRSGRLLGGQIVGKRGVAKRIDVLATALHNRMTISDLQRLDLSYAPPFAPVWDPILVAANVAAR